MTNRPLLVMFLGFPGSGKTFFATQLAGKLSAITLNSDALRVSMFGSLENIDKIRHSSQRHRLYDDVFGAMDYATKQSLSAGHSVIYDAQMTKRDNRRHLEQLAVECRALPVLVWVKTEAETAIERGQTRVSGDNSHPYTREKMKMLVERFDAVTDLPGDDENLIEISGEVPFEEQYEIFVSALNRFGE